MTGDKFRIGSSPAATPLCLALALAVLALLLGGCGGDGLDRGQAGIRRRLEVVRQTKKAELISFFEEIHAVASSAVDDQVLLRYFSQFQDTDGVDDKPGPRTIHELDRHYVDHYGQFYDLLMVDSVGFVFHSIRQESDYHTNLMVGDASSLLAQHLRARREPVFVDFEYYPPSEEPASFHVIPVNSENRFRGWLVFQTPVNNLNKMLIDRSNLGSTGEVYLVNRKGLMLSESRFFGEQTILSRTVETEATRHAFERGAGFGIITDYRGVPVFSAYDKCSILGNEWAIMAEIDEAEIVTNEYQAHRAEFQATILESIARLVPSETDAPSVEGGTVEVDMGEYGRAEPGQLLATSGVATCTAVGVTYPGRFGYLAHLTPTDDCYTDRATRLFLDARQSDLIGRLMNQVLRFDVLPYELGNLEIAIVATHDEAFLKIVDRLIENGLFLSQVKVVLRPDALYGNVYLDPSGGTVSTEWIGKDETSLGLQLVSKAPSLLTLVKAARDRNNGQ